MTNRDYKIGDKVIRIANPYGKAPVGTVAEVTEIVDSNSHIIKVKLNNTDTSVSWDITFCTLYTKLYKALQ